MSLRAAIVDDAGSTTPANLIWTLVLLAMAGLAIDTAQAYRVRSMLQHAVDAASLAAVQDLPDTRLAESSARSYITANLPGAEGEWVAKTAEIKFGNWNPINGAFLEAQHDRPWTRQDTVHITLARSAANDNPVGTFLLRLFGWRSWDIYARGVARISGRCEDVLANDLISINSDVSLDNGLCLYARDGVTLALQPMAAQGTQIGMLDLNDFSAGEFALIPQEVLFEADIEPKRALMIEDVIAEWLSDGIALGRPVAVVGELPPAPIPGIAYIVDGDLEVEGEYITENNIIAVLGDVRWRAEAALINANDCRRGAALGLYATGDIVVEREGWGVGLDIVAGRDINIEQNLAGLTAALEAGDDILMMADPKIAPCRPLWSVGGTVSRLLL